MIRVLMPLANGVEEMEAVIPADLFRRAEWSVTLAGLEEGPVTASRGIVLVPARTLDAALGNAFDLLFLPGGLGGTEAMMGDPRVLELARHFAEPERRVAAICAAPLVLDRAGVLEGRNYTCHPAAAERFTTGTRVEARVVADGGVYTSPGAGTALEFSLRLIADLDCPAKAQRIAAAILAV